MSDVLLQEAEDGVLTLTMNRPKALNALNEDLTQALREAIFAAEVDESVRCVVLRGEEHFMAGGDLKWFAQMLDRPAPEKRVEFEQFIHMVHPMIVSIRRMPKPVLASVPGAAAGFGLSLMSACDMAIAAEDAFFTLAYVNIGASPDGGSTYALPRLVGAKKAAEIAMLGDRFDAAAAKELGLINWVVPKAELKAETAKIAKRLAAGPTKVLGRTKALLQASINNSLESQLQREAETFATCASEADFTEGVTAFVGKWAPTFKG